MSYFQLLVALFPIKFSIVNYLSRLIISLTGQSKTGNHQLIFKTFAFIFENCNQRIC